MLFTVYLYLTMHRMNAADDETFVPGEIAAWLKAGKMRWVGNDLEVAPWAGLQTPVDYEQAHSVTKDKKTGVCQFAGYYDRAFLEKITISCKKKLNNWGFKSVSDDYLHYIHGG
jgi:hypothetical protein